MHPWASALVGVLWLAWVVYWALAARSVKPAERREGLLSRTAFVLAVAASFVLLAGRHWPGWLGTTLIPGGWMRYWCGIALLVAGLGFSVWARVVLGRNWSGTVTVKVGHELVRRGPYRHIRHPIYSGLLLAVLGSALTRGAVHGLLGFAVLFAALWGKLRLEERWMQREFGEQYSAYRRASWALVPFLI